MYSTLTVFINNFVLVLPNEQRNFFVSFIFHLFTFFFWKFPSSKISKEFFPKEKGSKVGLIKKNKILLWFFQVLLTRPSRFLFNFLGTGTWPVELNTNDKITDFFFSKTTISPFKELFHNPVTPFQRNFLNSLIYMRNFPQ